MKCACSGASVCVCLQFNKYLIDVCVVCLKYILRFEYLEHEYSAMNQSINHLHVTLCGDTISPEDTVTLGHVTVIQKGVAINVVSNTYILLLILITDTITIINIYDVLWQAFPSLHNENRICRDNSSNCDSNINSNNKSDSNDEVNAGFSMAVLFHPDWSTSTVLSHWQPLMSLLILVCHNILLCV